MKTDPNSYFDESLGEWITRAIKCPTGICPNCGSPNWQPRKFKQIYFCQRCIKGNLDECQEIEKAFEEL